VNAQPKRAVPNEFEIRDKEKGMGMRRRMGLAGFIGGPMLKRFVEGELKRNQVAAEHAEFAADNFIGFFNKRGFAFNAECLNKLFVRWKGNRRRYWIIRDSKIEFEFRSPIIACPQSTL